ncbi:hypothetical protein L7F22_032869 [Adiantum nelumboides]|nr:hypothetical protein [Adiantum nelumboides]
MINELHRKLDNVMLRRLKKDVVKELPTKSEKILRVEMSAMQQRMYKAILTRNYSVLSQQSMRRSACSTWPLSSKRRQIIRFCLMGQRAVGPQGRNLKGSSHAQRQDGSARQAARTPQAGRATTAQFGSETRKKSIEHFNAEGSPDFAFLLSTRAGGLGINLETADTVIIFDSDWNPQNDLQAMARAHRLNSKNHVSVYRLLTKDTVEEDVLERAKRKMVLEYAVIPSDGYLGQKFCTKNVGTEESEL